MIFVNDLLHHSAGNCCLQYVFLKYCRSSR